MILYFCIIGVCWLLASGFFSLILWENFFSIFGWIGLGILLTVAIDALTATIVRLLPAPKDKKIFQVSAKEKSFYEKLHIRKWKDRVPEIGHFTGFRKNKLDDPHSSTYVARFLTESRYGEVGHAISCFTAAYLFLGHCFAFIPNYWWALCLVIIAVNAFLNLLTCFVLRYNYYKLKQLHKALLRKEKRQSKQSVA